MSVVELLSSLAKKDIRLWLEGENLRFSAPEGAFTPEIRDQIVAQKPQIIEFLKQAQKATQAAIPKADRDQPLVASYAQQRLWILDQINPGDITYNMASALRIKGQIQPAILEKVFAKIVQRHESLRTHFAEQDGQPVQIIEPFESWQLPVTDLTDLDEVQRESAVMRAVQEDAQTSFNLATGPLFRAQLLVLNDDPAAPEYVLIANMHHVISDAWSMDVLIKEMAALYMAEMMGRSAALPELPIQYADYAAWQRQWVESQDFKDHLDYWQNTLAGAPQVLKLPADKARPEFPTSNGAIKSFTLSDSLAGQIKQFCNQQDLTPYMVLVGAWQLLLSRYADTRDVVIGAPIAGRDQSDVQELIGFFVNLLLLRVDLSGRPTVAEFYGRIKEMVLGGFNHQDVPIDMLLETMDVDRQPGYSPLAQAAFQLISVDDSAGDAFSATGPLSIEPIKSDHVSARMEMVLGIAKQGDQYSASLEYNTDLFNADTIEQVVAQYHYLLEQLVAGADQVIDDLSLYRDDYIRQYLALQPQSELIPLNANQLSMTLDEIANESTCQNAYGIHARLNHEIDIATLEQAIALVEQGSALLSCRLIQCDLNGAEPFYLYTTNETSALQQLDWSEQDETQIDARLTQLLHRRYQIFEERLVNYHLVKLDQGYLIAIGYHHILVDGASTFFHMEKLLTTYESLRCGQTPVLTPDRAYRRFLPWDKTHADSDAVLGFWREQLKTVEALDYSLPIDRQELPVSVVNDRVVTEVLSKGATEQIRHYCQEHTISVPLYFKALFSMLLQHYCRPEEDFAFFEFNANRRNLEPAALGCFYQQMPVPIDAKLWQSSGNLTDWFQALNQFRLQSRDYRAISLREQNRLVPRTRSTYMFNFYNFVLNVSVAGETVTPYMSAPKVDGGVQLIVREFANSVELELRYDVEVFEDLQFLQRLAHLSNQITSEEVVKFEQLNFLSARELNELQQWGQGESQPAPVGTLLSLFAEQVQQHPNNIAVCYDEERLSYRELDCRTNQLAHYLIAQGVGKGDRVGICMDRSTDFVMAVWAVLKAGAAYVPMDANYPAERLAYMAADSDAAAILTLSAFADRLPETQSKQFSLDQCAAQISACSDAAPATTVSAEDLIYIIYTSGSTGQPKGAAVTHQGEVNLQQWYLNDLDFNSESRSLLISAAGFDLTQKNLFAALLTGGTLVIPKMDFYDEVIILETIQREGITHINCAPSAFYPLVESALASHYQALMSLQYVVLGGEPIQLAMLYPWLSAANCKARIVNSYGPTECTDVVAAHILDRIESSDQGVPLGSAIANVQLHVINELDQPVVPGCIGELAITGICVGKGYLNKPELTAKVFIDNPFGDGKLYKTGDLVRYDRTGLLHYVGRKDFQIKLRGLRIELGEIESALKQLPQVKDTLVLLIDDALVAYVVNDSGVTIEGWRDQLRQSLPDYMVPAALVCLAQWPLTPNGKVDRKALPKPEEVDLAEAVYVAPRNELEQKLVSIWQEVLEQPNIGVLDNLFDLGGNSLLATRIMSRVRKIFAVDIQVRELLMKPDIASLAERINYALEGGIQQAPPIEPVDSAEPQPLSFAQQRLWFLDKLDPGNAAYNMPGAFKLKGQVDRDLLQRVLAEILQRHESLRTNFIDQDDTPYQVVRSVNDWTLPEKDITHLPSQDRELEARRLAQIEVSYSFDLANEPLFRAQLLKLADDEAVLLLNMHHIITDGWSNGVLMQEIATLYEAFRHQKPSPLTPLKIQYTAFSAWQRNWLQGEVLDKQIEFWRRQLSDVPPLELPFDRKRGPVQTYNGAYEHFQFSESLSKNLNLLSRQNGVTLFQTLLAAFNVLLHRYSGQSEFAVGTPIANRNRAELEPIIGFFVNTLALKANFTPDESFATQLAKVRETTLDAYAHQDLPFERLVDELNIERDVRISPIFQVMFNMVNGPSSPDFKLPGLTISPLGEAPESVKFDLNLDVGEQQGHLVGSLGYNTDLFNAATIKRMLESFERILGEVIKHPDINVNRIDILSREERDQQLYGWNQTEVDYDKSLTVDGLIAQQCQASPDATAIICGEDSLTYHQLDCVANAIAVHLIQCGVKPGDRVGLCFDRHLLLIPSVLGILKAGGTYVPLDAAYPAGRIQYIVEDAGIQYVLSRETVSQQLATGDWQPINVDQLIDEHYGSLAKLLQQKPVIDQPITADSSRLLYMIYTSGTTGRPKGTGTYHQAEVNLLNWYTREFTLTCDDRVLLMSAIGFDLTQKNLFAPLTKGAALVVPEFQEYDAAQLSELIAKQKVTWINCAPSAFYPLQDEPEEWDKLESVSRLFLGGEAINLPRLEKWVKHSSCQLINSYGPTECTDIAAWYRIDLETDLGAETLPIGHPNDNVRLYILDEQQQLLPTGALGELYIGGDGVGPGYLNNAELTEQAFIQSPFTQHRDILYKTGDRVRYRHDGAIEYFGRNDHQIKVRGVRIEAGEVQSVINEFAGVIDSLVGLYSLNAGAGAQPQLAAWVVTDKDESEYESLQQQLKAHVAHFLPLQMQPALWGFVSEFPLTPNGKVDRKALPAPTSTLVQKQHIAPATETEQRLATIWHQVLQLPEQQISVDDNFFEIGGHSILATQVASRIKQTFALQIPLRTLFENPRLQNVAAVLDELLAKGDQGENVPELKVVDRDQPLPLSFVQQQLWLLDQLDPGTAAYNMPVAVRLKGQVDVPVLNAALTTVVERHETLRSRFVQVDGEPRVVIEPAPHWQIKVVSLADHGSEVREKLIKEMALHESDRGFDLATGPLLRTTLIKCFHDGEPEQWVFLATMHHIVSDGWSMELLIKEVGAVYAALKSNSSPMLPALKYQYVDFAAWQRQWLQGNELNKQIDYWRGELDNEYAVLDLPTDYPRPAVQTVNGAAVTHLVPTGVIENISQLARHQGATLFMGLLSAFKWLLHRYSDQAGINIGVPIAGRLRSEVEPLIGMFINTVVVSTELDDELTYLNLLDRVKEKSLGAYAHQALPFEKIVEELKPKRDLSRTPFYQVFFNLLNLPEGAQPLPDLEIEPIITAEDEAHAKFDLNLYAKETEQGLQLHMVYNSDLYAAERMQRMLKHFALLLQQVAAAPSVPLISLPLDPTDEFDVRPNPQQPIIAGGFEHPLAAFEKQVQDNGSQVAIEDASQQLSYQQLHLLLLKAAAELKEVGVRPGDTVAIYGLRDASTVVSMLAALRAGAAFTMLDPAYPEDRLEHYLAISQPKALLLSSSVNLSDSFVALLAKNNVDHQVVVNTLAEVVPEQAALYSESWPKLNSNAIAYIAYTSGTTGLPKAISGTMNPVAHFIEWYQSEYQLSAADRFSMLSGIAHDPLLRDVFTPLAIGSTLVIPSPVQLLDPLQLLQWFAEKRISVTHLTPAMGQLLTGATDWQSDTGVEEQFQLPCLRLAAFGGDRLTMATVKALLAYAPSVQCSNFYGATETPQAMSHQQVVVAEDDKNAQFVPVGKGIDGSQLLIVKPNHQLASVGEVGEIWIRSPYLSSGYLNEDEQQRFISNPFANGQNATDRIYRTGDKGRYLEDGSVHFLGRLDQQIKIRGFRVEPAEVQQALNMLDSIQSSVVVDGVDQRGDVCLIAYLVCHPDTELPDNDELRQAMRRHLPDYMVPSVFAAIDSIPLTPNGKLDRRALPDIDSLLAEKEIVAPRTEMETEIAEIWQQVLKVQELSVTENFFDAGGHSLLATQIVARVKEKYGVDFSMRVLFEVSTVEGMANYVETTLWARGGLEEPTANDDEDMEEFEI